MRIRLVSTGVVHLAAHCANTPQMPDLSIITGYLPPELHIHGFGVYQVVASGSSNESADALERDGIKVTNPSSGTPVFGNNQLERPGLRQRLAVASVGDHYLTTVKAGVDFSHGVSIGARGDEITRERFFAKFRSDGRVDQCQQCREQDAGVGF